jgi:NTE family protein
MEPSSTWRKSVPINLALQGGGAHGAFTWGVLDRLLEEPWVDFDGVSGTSSGAMNAVALAQGWMDGGRDGARACLATLWESVAREASLIRWAFSGPGGRTAETMLLELTRYFTPKEINPLDYNPVRKIAAELFDFERLRNASALNIFLAATRVRDGRLRLFDNANLTLEALLASTCLPQLFAPVEIEGEMYWDGGYAGNPVLEPLLYRCRSADILCVLVQPLERAQAPRTVREIGERVVELGFATTFLRELDTLWIAKQSLAGTFSLTWLGRRLKRLRMHMIEPGESLDAYSAKTRAQARIEFLRDLRDLGRQSTQAWLDANAHELGANTTFKR